jgi:hypothetical protein
MPISARYILMSDDIRREDTGKFFIIGLYTPDMAVSQIPFVMPTIAFLVNLESDRQGNFNFRTKVQHQETGDVLPPTVVAGTLAVTNPQNPVIVPFRFGGVGFNVQGLYSFSLEIDAQDPIVSTFNVQLITQQSNPMLMGGLQR